MASTDRFNRIATNNSRYSYATAYNANNKTLSGRAPRGAQVPVYVDNTLNGTATADESGNWSLVLSGTINPGQAVKTGNATGNGVNQRNFTIPTAPALGALSLSAYAPFSRVHTPTIGEYFAARIAGGSGGVLSLSGAGSAGLSISQNYIISGYPTTAGPIDVIETLGTASNSPRTTSAITTTVTSGAGGGGTGSKLFVFAGQSNMDGVTGSVPAALVAAMPNVKVWNGTAFVDYQANVSSNLFGDGTGWGPEAQFLLRYAQANPAETIYAVKYAIRGTRLAADTGLDWSPSSVSEYWDTLVSGVTAAKAAMPAAGGAPVVPAVFWMQGENDAQVQTYAAAYNSNLTALIASARSRIGSASTAFILGRIHNTRLLADYPYKAIVRRAQYDVTKSLAGVSVVNTDDFEIGSDGLHYTANGLVSLGEAMYGAYVGSYSYNGDTTPPVITSASAFSIVENQTAVATLTANKNCIWSAVGGPDKDRFQFGVDGTLSFTTAPDFEAPSDVGSNNVYDVVVRATSDAGFTVDQTIAVTVTDDTAEGGGATYEPEASAYFARMAVQPDATRKGHLNTLVSSLKSSGVYAKLAGLYVMAAHDAQAARLNLIGNVRNLIVTGDPTFTANRGYAGVSGGYLSDGTAFNSHANQNSETVFAWANDAPDSAPFFGAYNSVSPFYGASAFWSGGNAVTRLMSSTNLSVTNANTLGFIAASRTASGTVIMRSNGTDLTPGGQTSTGVPNGPFQVCAWNSGASLKQVAFAGYGSGLTAAELGSLHSALLAYRTAIGL